MTDRLTARRLLCKVNEPTDDKTWCSLPARYAVQPACACDWVWVVCGRHLSSSVLAGTHRVDSHMSRNAVRVTALEEK